MKITPAVVGALLATAGHSHAGVKYTRTTNNKPTHPPPTPQLLPGCSTAQRVRDHCPLPRVAVVEFSIYFHLHTHAHTGAVQQRVPYPVDKKGLIRLEKPTNSA